MKNVLSNLILDQDSSEEELADLVNLVKAAPDQRDRLLEFLPEEHPVYRGRGANQAIHMRGYLMAAFERVGLPEAALPYVLAELQNGREAYLVAAAAMALRGLARPASDLIPFLFKAVDNLRLMDDALSFEQYKPSWPLHEHTSALREIFRSFAWLGSQAQGALPRLEGLSQEQDGFSAAIRQEIQAAIRAIRASAPPPSPAFVPLAILGAPLLPQKKTDQIPEVELEDQDGQRLTYAEYFSRKPSIVVFFYTRCNNPNKCSLTITKLGQLQTLIRENGLEGQLKTAAISYDPDYDLAPRLKGYGLHRGVQFGADERFFRAPEGLAQLQDYFGLGVNFSGTTVNQHRIELFILDRAGRVASTFTRLQWDLREVLEAAQALIK